MASMIAKACSSNSTQIPAMTVHENGSRNKRKFRADPPLVDRMKSISSPLNECTSFEFSAEKFEGHGPSNKCDMCCLNQDNSDLLKLDLGLSCAMSTSEVGMNQPREDIDSFTDDFHDADWSDLTESELEDIVLSNLDTIFRSAIKKIVASGYSEDAATKAILRPGLWYGYKDTVSNLAENTLAFLSSAQEIGPSVNHPFEDLQQMEKYILAELVCLLREVCPFFSTGDAMWCLLICDMNISHACAMDTDSLGSFLNDRAPDTNILVAAPHSKTDPKGSHLVPFKTNARARSFQSAPSNMASVQAGNNFQSEALKEADGSNLTLKMSIDVNGQVPEKESQNFSPTINEKTFSVGGTSHAAGADEKTVSSRKVSGIAKRDHILRQKSMHLEKHYRSYGSKNSFRSGSKTSSFGGLIFDKKLKGVADSTGLNSKSAPFSINKGVGSDLPQENDNRTLPATNGLSASPTFALGNDELQSSLHAPSISFNSNLLPVNTVASLPGADTELSLSFPAKSIDEPLPTGNNVKVPNMEFLSSSDDKLFRQRLSNDRKEEIILTLVPRARALQDQLQEWTEWANQKIMQAARRLGKDKAELKTLRQEKEEVERLKKEKLTLEENTSKKLSEMKNALGKASGQVERATAAVRRLEAENILLRREMENSKIYAAKSAANCHEASEREKKTLMGIQSWEKQRKVLLEELSAENMKLMQMQQRLVLAKSSLAQVEDKLNQEQKAKDDLLTQVSHVQKEREQIEESTQSKEEAIKSTAESNLLKYKQDIRRLEKEVSLLRLKTDLSKIVELRGGLDGSYTPKVTYSKDSPSIKDSSLSIASRSVTNTYTQDMSSVKRERECVMCLSEEMSVVFLPCAHQVVCTMCNELHEKKGMQYCPSCRSPIERRICVRYAVS